MSLKADLVEKRNRLGVQANELLETASRESRNLTPEEEQRFDAMHADIDKHGGDIARIDRQEALAKRLEESAGRPGTESSRELAPIQGAAVRRIQATQRDQDLAFRSWFLAGVGQANEEGKKAALRVGINLDRPELTLRFRPRPPVDLRAARAWMEGTSQGYDLEQRAQTITTTGGGYIIPDSPMAAIETALLTFGGMRQVATIMRTDSGSPLPIPTSNDTANKGAILAINTQVSAQDLTFGQVVLNAFKYSSKLVLVPIELIQDAAFDIGTYIGTRLGERIGRILNDHFTVGVGTTEPQGVVPGAFLGVTGATGSTTSVTYSSLVDLEHSVDPAYRTNARFMFPDAMLKAIKKLVDANDRPLWQPGLAGLTAGTPDSILGYPYVINQSMATPAANAKSILFGDFSKYMIRDVMDIQLLRLQERYADFHQVGFFAFSRHDGAMVDAGTHPIRYYVNSAT